MQKLKTVLSPTHTLRYPHCSRRRSDYFETLEECALLPGCLPVGLGPGCTVKKCIIDKNSRIGANVQIVNKDNVQARPRRTSFSPRAGRQGA